MEIPNKITKKKTKERMLLILFLIVVVGIFILLHKYLDLGIFYSLIATLFLLTIVGFCWEAWKKEKKRFIKEGLLFLLTLFIVIIVAKETYPDWISISVYGGVMVVWGYFLRGFFDKINKNEENN